MNIKIYQNLYVYLSLPKYDASHFTKLYGYVRCLYELDLIDVRDFHSINNLINDYQAHQNGYLNAVLVDKFMQSFRDKYEI